MITFDGKVFVDREREIRGFDKLLGRTLPVAIMRIRAGEKMGKTWLLDLMSSRCREPGCGVVAVQVALHNPRDAPELLNTISLVRLLRDRIGRPAAFGHLNAVINSFTEPGGETPVSALAALSEKIEESYDLAELARLSEFLDVPWENLTGGTRYQKASALVGYLHRRDCLAKLLDRLKQEREHIAWEDWQAPSSPAGASPAASPAEEDRGAPLPANDARGRSLAERRINDAFFTCLAELARTVPILFLFDGCEKAPDELDDWIRHQLVDRLARRELAGVLVVLAGRPHMKLADLSLESILQDTELDPFDKPRLLEYFAAHGVQVSEGELPTLLRFSGGKPGLLAELVENARPVVDKKDPFWDD